MTEQIRKNYFLAVKMLLVLAGIVYLLMIQFQSAGASSEMFLLLALFFGSFTGEILLKNNGKLFFLLLSVIELLLLIYRYGKPFLLLAILLAYEMISCLRNSFYEQGSMFWYGLPLLLVLVPGQKDYFLQGAVTILTGMLYIQQDFIIASYQKQIQENTRSEQDLKRSMHKKEHALKEEIKSGLLVAENQVLEERARLSQTLHDKLGHSINGSVYQLEAVKVLLEKDPDTSKKMIQAVIDQLRSGMDEIRAILRRERPPKYKLALLQLERLCEECKEMDIDAGLITEGNLGEVPERYLEIVLDNAFEAVSNALKYAHCTKIEIKLVVMPEILRCSISDNGIGCGELVDGMGISGMRQRIRNVNGIIDFSTEAGFTINMLLPMKK